MSYNIVPNYAFLGTFGCLTFPYLRAYTSYKFEPWSTCVFLGYALQYIEYLCLELGIGKIFTSRHMQFRESEFLLLANITEESLSTNQKEVVHLLSIPLSLDNSYTLNPSCPSPPLLSDTTFVSSSLMSPFLVSFPLPLLVSHMPILSSSFQCLSSKLLTIKQVSQSPQVA